MLTNFKSKQFFTGQNGSSSPGSAAKVHRWLLRPLKPPRTSREKKSSLLFDPEMQRGAQWSRDPPLPPAQGKWAFWNADPSSLEPLLATNSLLLLSLPQVVPPCTTVERREFPSASTRPTFPFPSAALLLLLRERGAL